MNRAASLLSGVGSGSTFIVTSGLRVQSLGSGFRDKGPEFMVLGLYLPAPKCTPKKELAMLSCAYILVPLIATHEPPCIT